MCTYFILQYKQVLLADDLEPMMTTLQAALAPLLTFGSICGLGFFEYHGHSMPYLSYPYVLVIWGLVIYFGYYSLFLIWLKHPNFIFKYWINFVILITAITSILVTWFHFKVKVLYVYQYVYQFYM